LEELRKKGLSGQLKEGELARWRRKGNPTDAGIKAFLSKLRNLRMRGSQLATMPPDVIADLDEAIGKLEKAVAEAKN
jgi:hypothetical protein